MTRLHGSYEKRINCSVRLDDYRRLEEAAKRHDMRVTPFLRDAALAYSAGRFLVPPRLDELLSRLIAETRRVGNNVNQVAARVNTRQAATQEDVRQVTAAVREIEDASRILRVVIQNLHHDHQVSESQDS